MRSPVYDILESLHEDVLREHQQNPTAFTGQVLRSVGEAMAQLERAWDASVRHSRAARKGWAKKRAIKKGANRL